MTLGDDLLLLAAVRQKYRVWLSTLDSLDLAIGAADLIELVMARRIEVTAREIRVVDPQAVGDPVLDAVLGELAAADEPTSPLRWFRRRRRPAEPHVRGLVQAGVLGLDRPRRRLSLRHTVLLDPDRRVELCARVDSVAHGAAPRDMRHRVLIGLVCRSQLHRVLYPGWHGRRVRSRLSGEGWLAHGGAQPSADVAADPVLLASIDAVLHAAGQAEYYPG